MPSSRYSFLGTFKFLQLTAQNVDVAFGIGLVGFRSRLCLKTVLCVLYRLFGNTVQLLVQVLLLCNTIYICYFPTLLEKPGTRSITKPPTPPTELEKICFVKGNTNAVAFICCVFNRNRRPGEGTIHFCYARLKHNATVFVFFFVLLSFDIQITTQYNYVRY